MSDEKVIGAEAFGTHMRIISATPGIGTKDGQIQNVSKLIKESTEFLDIDCTIKDEDIEVFDQYGGSGYGYVTEEKAEAIKLVAETEGLFLDPVYTGSSMACLIQLCREGFFKSTETVVYLHTGGSAALFPYKKPLKAYMANEDFPWIIPPWSPKSN